MAVAFAHFIAGRRDLGGLISAGGSGGTALATPAMRALPVGVPKVMVSSVASGDVKPYVGPADICMMYSVTDIAGHQPHLREGARQRRPRAGRHDRLRGPAGAATEPPGARADHVRRHDAVRAGGHAAARGEYDCLVFHATGTGGQSMEKLVDSGLLAGVHRRHDDEIADEIVGGVLSARARSGWTRFARAAVPYVGSCGALDMVNFWAMDTVPARVRGSHPAPPQPERDADAHDGGGVRGDRAVPGDKLNRMEGPVRFLIPEGGLSLIDAPGGPFWDPAADRALFDTHRPGFRRGLEPQARRAAAQRQRPGVRGRAGRSFGEIARTALPPAARCTTAELTCLAFLARRSSSDSAP